jgi:hypothetical protein
VLRHNYCKKFRFHGSSNNITKPPAYIVADFFDFLLGMVNQNRGGWFRILYLQILRKRNTGKIKNNVKWRKLLGWRKLLASRFKKLMKKATEEDSR